MRSRGFRNALQRRVWQAASGKLFCAYCGIPLIDRPGATHQRLTRDHVFPRSFGGRLTVPACKHCNGEKGNADLATWLASPPLQQRRRQVQHLEGVSQPWDWVRWTLWVQQVER